MSLCYYLLLVILIIGCGSASSSDNKFNFNVALQNCIHRDPKDYYYIRDKGPRTASSTVTQPLLSSDCTKSSMLLYVHRDHKDYLGLGAQDGYFDFHTAPELCPSNNTVTWSFYGIPKLVPASHQVAQSLRFLMGSFVHQVWPVIQSNAEKKGLIMGSKT